ncbi:MAG: type II secretion system inner membrane protein GspF [Deltaproteobacteria bacterium]|nr:type II secretion system inner membrane protein GspF [Deltaproteobacteria bacterium]MBW2019206.1 type II secretion system inner membrane protein GspF [Deltaproteobacteria bacterium]MBW2074009.1 type II secretion system inner membrane protein GspF [Deltaproteobacteria bacterium]
MPVYEYTALDRSGKRISGITDADSAVAARQKLRGSGIFPVEVKETSSKPRGLRSGRISSLALLKRIKPGEVSVATRQLSTLLSAGVPLVASLEALISQMTNPLFKKVMAQIKESVNEGNSLAYALSNHPRIFSSVYVNMVRAGEASGSLDVVLDRLANLGEHQQALRGRFKAALAYPVFMFFIGTLVLFFLVTFIVPNITQIFKEMHHALPIPTMVLIRVSNFLKSFWWLILLVTACGIIITRQFKKTPRGRYVWDEVKLRIPVLGPINKKIALARFGRTLGSLLQAGVPFVSALQIVRNIVNNVIIAKVIDNAIEEIQAGKSLASPLSQSPWFPSIVVQMISVGEQSGDLETMLNKIADTYERDVESQIMAMTSMLEPVMILVMGLIVGFIVVSILLPIFEMNQMIR